MDYGCFNSDFFSITKTTSSETDENIPQDYSSHLNTICTGSLSKQL